MNHDKDSGHDLDWIRKALRGPYTVGSEYPWRRSGAYAILSAEVEGYLEGVITKEYLGAVFAALQAELAKEPSDES